MLVVRLVVQLVWLAEPEIDGIIFYRLVGQLAV